jgi:hypothetical protein
MGRLALEMDCKVCMQSLPHVEEKSVAPGRLFLLCVKCGTIQNIPMTQELRDIKAGPRG